MTEFIAKEMSPEKFTRFEINTTTYKTIGEHSIGVDVLIPKGLKAADNEKLPLIVRFHGGFLITGSSLLPLFFANWILDLAKRESAIIVSADYRLLPEANGLDILDDINDVFAWIHNGSLQLYLNETLGSTAPKVDVSRILTVGDSAGGYVAIQAAIHQPKHAMKMVVGLYPQLDVASDWFNTSFDKPLFGMPQLPSAVVDSHLAASPRGTVVSTAQFPARLDLAVAIVQNGRILEFLGKEDKVLPLKSINVASDFPPLLIILGKDDTIIPVEGSQAFVEAVKKAHPNTPVRLDEQPGDHGFDAETELDADWLQPNLEFIKQHWLG